ncbi:MAG: hypothetical protein ACHQYQ_11050, partial [Bacteriovoracales bacterium]
MKKVLFITFFSLMGIKIFAKECDFGGEKLYSYSASIDRDVSYEFSLTGNVVDPKSSSRITINNCVLNKRKTLLVTLAPLEYGLETTSNFANYENEIQKGNCTIENAPFKDIQNFEEKLENNRKKFKFIKECVDIRITHLNPRPIKIKNDPEKCNVTKISDQEVIVRGVRCELDLDSGSFFEINYSIRKECRNLENLKTLGLTPMENITRAMFYTLDNSTDGERLLIGSSMVRFNLEPSSAQGKLSLDLEDKGIPVYFSNYQVPDVYFGEIMVKNQRNLSMLSMKILANNRCKKLCAEGVCTSPCDYSVPFVGLFSLYQGTPNGKKLFLNEWYDGTAIPANFQGLIPLQDRKVPDFKDAKSGEEFFIEVALYDPKYEYQMLKNNLKGILPPLPGIPSVEFYSNLNNGLPGFSGTGTYNTIPQFGTIGDFTGGNSIGGLGSLESVSKSTHW